MNDNNEIKEVVENVKDTTDNIQNEVKASSGKKWILAIVVIVAIAAIIGYFVLNNNKIKSGITNTNLGSAIGKVDSNKITFETITNQYLKVIDNGIVENGNGNIKVEINNFGTEKQKDKINGKFSDDIKYSAKADLKAKKTQISFNNVISFNSEKTEKTPAIKMEKLPFGFEILADNTKMYFKINTDINKILAVVPTDEQSKQMVKAMVGGYLGKYFVLNTEEIPGIDEKMKKDMAVASIEEIKKQMQMFNKYNKQYNAFSLKSTGKTEKVNGVKATKFEVKIGETKNVIKFFQAVISDIQNKQLENSPQTTEQEEIKKQLAEVNSQIDTFFADPKKSKAMDNIIKENIDSSVFVWVSENGLPVKSSFKLNIENTEKMMNQLEELSGERKGEKVVGNLKININFTEEVGYNQKIDIKYPENATDFMQLVGDWIGMAG